MADITNTTSKLKRGNNGFRKASSLTHRLTQKTFEKRGFAQSKLITHWDEIVGLELSQLSKPLKITFPKGNEAATLTIEIVSSFGPELDLQKDLIKERVNRVYGYTAVHKVKFKSSSFLGYTPVEKGAFAIQNNKNYRQEKNISFNKNTDELITKIEETKNQSLKKTLSILSSNFKNNQK